MEIGIVLSANTLQGQIVRELLTKLPPDHWQNMSGQSVVLSKEFGRYMTYISVDETGVVVTWRDELRPPVMIDPDNEIQRPQTAKGNNLKQIVKNTIRLHEINLKP